jgi:hypothetical protein
MDAACSVSIALFEALYRSSTQLARLRHRLLWRGKTYGKQLVEHHHRRNRPCTYPIYTIHQSHPYQDLVSGSGGSRWLLFGLNGLKQLPHNQFRSQTGECGSLPIVNDESCDFFCI